MTARRMRGRYRCLPMLVMKTVTWIGDAGDETLAVAVGVAGAAAAAHPGLRDFFAAQKIPRETVTGRRHEAWRPT